MQNYEFEVRDFKNKMHHTVRHLREEEAVKINSIWHYAYSSKFKKDIYQLPTRNIKKWDFFEQESSLNLLNKNSQMILALLI